MVIHQEIKQDDFRFCPTCGVAVTRKKIVGNSWREDTADYLVCIKCGKQYLLQLGMDYG